MKIWFVWTAGIIATIAAGGLTPIHAEVTISTAQTHNMSCTNGVCTPTAKKAVLNVNDLTNMLASGNVSVNTGSGSLPAQVKNIVVSAGFSWTSASSLTLDAYDSVTFNRAVSVAGSGGVTLTTNDGGANGVLSFAPKGNLSFLSTANSLTINGKAYTLASSVASLAADIASNPSGAYALSANYVAKPDGIYPAAPIATTFEGTFNGLGNTISYLAIKGAAKGLNLGLFADVDTAGAINSIRLTNSRIKAQENSYVGVLTAVNYGSIFNSFASGVIVAAAGSRSGNFEGGLVGGNYGALDQAAASTSIAVNGDSPLSIAFVGGLVGANAGTMQRSYATGAALAGNGVGHAVSGGLVGFSAAAIHNCYATGAASIGVSTEVGGLVGYNGHAIDDSYSTGAPTAAGGLVGGSIGYDGSNGGISNDYWDTTTSDITNLSQGAGNIANDPGITGETTAQLQAGLPAGFDPKIWAENPKINGGLPYLIANPPQ